MARQRKRNRKLPEDEAFTRSDFGRIAGVVLLLIAFVMLTTTPGRVVEAWHRADYVETMARVERRNQQHRGGMVVTLLSTGEKIYVRHPVPELISPSPVRVLYNPDASALIAFSAFDTPVRIRSIDARVLAPGPLPTLGPAMLAVIINLLALIAAVLMVLQPRWRRRQ